LVEAIEGLLAKCAGKTRLYYAIRAPNFDTYENNVSGKFTFAQECSLFFLKMQGASCRLRSLSFLFLEAMFRLSANLIKYDLLTFLKYAHQGPAP